ncbi:MAG TPA: Ig-like domain-containing protein [Capillimicrobium sp.]|nr:Ig-like domain-containing protein [Capillimicrobium sp.]
MLKAGVATAVAAVAIAMGAGSAAAAPFTCTPPAPANVETNGTMLFYPKCSAMFSGTRIDVMPQHGTLVHESAGFGAVRYTADPGYVGPDSFTYHAYDGDFDAAPMTQQLDVGVNTPPTCDPTSPDWPVRAGKPFTFAMFCRDPDGGPVTVEIVSAPTRGTLSPVTPVGIHFETTYEVTSPGGPDSFSFRASDGTAYSQTVTQTIRALGSENAVPSCSGRAVTVKPGESVGIPSWLCTDADYDPLTLSIVTPPAKGTTQIFQPGGAAPAGISYTAAANARGTDSFTFTAGDGMASASPATVTITIDDGSAPSSPPPPDTSQPQGGSTGPPATTPPPAPPRPAGLKPVAGVDLGDVAAAFVPRGGARPASLLVLTCGSRCTVRAAPRLLLSGHGASARAAGAVKLEPQELQIAAGGRATLRLELSGRQRAALRAARAARVRIALVAKADGAATARDTATLRLIVR